MKPWGAQAGREFPDGISVRLPETVRAVRAALRVLPVPLAGSHGIMKDKRYSQ
jgi:hypothetical protein